MLVQLLLSAALLTAIFFVTRRFSALLFMSVFRLTGNKRFALWTVALVLLPGTIVHELSHFLVATLVRVPTGHLSVFPNFKHVSDEKEQDLLMGHIQIAQTGPLRHALIGIAPLIIGLILIYLTGQIVLNNFSQTIYNLQPTTIIGFYLLFVVSSTMFTSRSDLRSFIFVAPVVLLLSAALYFAGVRISVTRNLLEILGNVIQRVNFSLAVSAVIDGAILLMLRSLIFCTEKIKRLVKG